jgi:hypothetical protein
MGVPPFHLSFLIASPGRQFEYTHTHTHTHKDTHIPHSPPLNFPSWIPELTIAAVLCQGIL